jgi:hypothetical protein
MIWVMLSFSSSSWFSALVLLLSRSSCSICWFFRFRDSLA